MVSISASITEVDLAGGTNSWYRGWARTTATTPFCLAMSVPFSIVDDASQDPNLTFNGHWVQDDKIAVAMQAVNDTLTGSSANGASFVYNFKGEN